MIIAIDGPAGAGKSTVAKILAKRLGFLYIDTGAMYRALTLKVLENNVPINDEPGIIQLAQGVKIGLRNNTDGSLTVMLDGKDVSLAIRQGKVTQFVSDVAKIKEVRQVLVKMQREFGQKGDCVLDGRDIGTVVFPQAAKKFFIDASIGVRVQRRFKELKGLGQKVTEDEVAFDLANRDKIDSTRLTSPLRLAPDAIYIDTTDFSIEQIVEKMFNLCNIEPSVNG
ncbi:MAG: (d)CMP kinase [Candidatus Omnitrophica bacterium]|nr:(d)CMP kinase [Candidatus Omnitrophota bacterium]MBU4303399.1 (d)CMP kinase [Candidatus Omnitrophota bacterium]MBU4468785.1 (d)CMP kinase [Candidatus Omnitrophota bacterium]MCG2708072.1 (d)CMP kinase [Candidatus Omnitrophota bacterium]